MAEVDSELAKQGALLVEERVLRRVIKGHRKLRGVGLQVPHEKCYALRKVDLEPHVEQEDLAIELAELPDRLVLISSDRERLAAHDPETTNAAWRSLFHGAIHQAFDDLLRAQKLTASAIRERINRVGQTEFDEIRSVLKQEDLLLPPVDDIATYVEFVALYLELEYFAPSAIERTFPALFDIPKVDAAIRVDVDAEAILVRTRPPGAPDRPVIAAVQTREEVERRRAVIGESAKRSAQKSAMRARTRGNRSRAALLHYRAGQDRAGEADIGELVARLSKALALRDAAPDIDATTTARWVAALVPVAVHAGHQASLRLTAGARLLYDLQAACVVAEREVKVVDVFAWALSLGKTPVVRALPATREVRIAKHIHAAIAKIPASGVPSKQLSDALYAIAARADDNVRKVMRPKIEAALDAVDLHPHSLPERVGEKKLVDELLDQAVTVGRLTIGNLRDAISKNDLKVPDLTLAELQSGDQLLRTDKLLAKSMDGVYRRGESYMRFLQKISSVLFGTPIGRFLTLYAMLPLLGAYATVQGLQHMIGPLWHKLFGIEPEIATTTSLVATTGFLWLLLHVRPFRTLMVWLALKLVRGLKLLLWDLPRAIWRHPIAVAALRSKLFRWVIRPALPAAFALLVIPKAYLIPELELPWCYVIAGAVYLVAMAVMNSRFGRITEERMTDGLVRSSRHVTTRLVPGAVKLILQMFAKLIELFDRGIYRVDEWLRFRTGQSRLIIAIKGAIGVIWFLITYVLRLYINLFIEPTVNPIKHFPVVTVAAKLIIPFLKPLFNAVYAISSPIMGPTIGSSFAGFSVLVIPGLAGFLVWELKENWRLYRATRPKALRPLSIGHHGESMVGFLKPGFHSGTIPKLYTKLRRAAWNDDERGVAKQKEGLHHVEEAIGMFVDRQLVSMLNEVPAFTPTDVALQHVEIGSNRVQVELVCPSIGPNHARIRFEQQSGWLVASIPEPGWIDRLDDNHRKIFEIALTGFYKLSGAEIVREQVEHVLRGEAITPPPYDIADEGLLVWPGNAYDTEAIYNLRSKKLLPAMRGSRFEGGLPDLRGRHALFVREPLYWSVWSTAWQQIARGDPPMPLLVGPSLLPQVHVAAERAA
ncbi:MAG: hypothetical protein ABI867_07080 [Kofleriaceae bacterium]